MRSHISRAGLALLALATLFGLGAVAQEPAANNMEILRAKIDADKKLVVAANLVLTESQATAFWPIYDQYQGELRALNQRLGRLILDYAEAYNSGPVSDAQATTLLDEAIAIEEAEAALPRTYADRLDGVIPAVEVARYLQIERKIRAVVNFDLAAEIPLVE